jgi:hypothetical protein
MGCSISFTDESKTETLNNSATGQTALYWIIINTPEHVKLLLYR